LPLKLKRQNKRDAASFPAQTRIILKAALSFEPLHIISACAVGQPHRNNYFLLILRGEYDNFS